MVDKPKITYEWVPVEKIFIESIYQRELNQNWVDKKAKEFDPRLLGVLVVSRRSNGVYAAFDGQHRCELVKIVGLKKIFCEVHHGLTVQEEAELFRLRNTTQRKVKALEIYHAEKAAGDEQSLEIESIVESIGCKIPRSGPGKLNKARNSIGAINTLKKIHARYGSNFLLLVLSLIKETWPKNGDAFRSSIIEGMAVFMHRHQTDPIFSRKRFAEKLHWVEIATIASRANARKETGGGNAAYHIADVLLEEYNKNLKTKMAKSSGGC